jgi:hypothetical protein
MRVFVINLSETRQSQVCGNSSIKPNFIRDEINKLNSGNATIHFRTLWLPASYIEIYNLK